MSSPLVSVLVVEDDPEINALVGAYVELCGYEYRAALDGAAALAEAARRTPSAVILDLMLPDIDGFEIARRLRAIPDMMHTPIIVLSAMGDADSRQRSQASGADEHLTTPFDPDEFMQVLKSRVGGSPSTPK